MEECQQLEERIQDELTKLFNEDEDIDALASNLVLLCQDDDPEIKLHKFSILFEQLNKSILDKNRHNALVSGILKEVLTIFSPEKKEELLSHLNRVQSGFLQMEAEITALRIKNRELNWQEIVAIFASISLIEDELVYKNTILNIYKFYKENKLENAILCKNIKSIIKLFPEECIINAIFYGPSFSSEELESFREILNLKGLPEEEIEKKIVAKIAANRIADFLNQITLENHIAVIADLIAFCEDEDYNSNNKIIRFSILCKKLDEFKLDERIYQSINVAISLNILKGFDESVKVRLTDAIYRLMHSNKIIPAINTLEIETRELDWQEIVAIICFINQGDELASEKAIRDILNFYASCQLKSSFLERNIANFLELLPENKVTIGRKSSQDYLLQKTEPINAELIRIIEANHTKLKRPPVNHLMIGSYRLKDIFGLSEIEDPDLANSMIIAMLCQWANGKNEIITRILSNYGFNDKDKLSFISSLISNKVIFARALTDLIAAEQFESASILDDYKIFPSEDIKLLKESMSEASKNYLNRLIDNNKENILFINTNLMEKIATNHSKIMRGLFLNEINTRNHTKLKRPPVDHLMLGSKKLKDIFGLNEIENPDLANSMVIAMLCQWASGKNNIITGILSNYGFNNKDKLSFISSLISNKVIFARALTDLIAAEQFESASILDDYYRIVPSEDIHLLNKSMSEASKNYLNGLIDNILFINTNLMEKIEINHAKFHRDPSSINHLMLGSYRLKDIFGLSDIENPDLANSMVIDILCQWANGKNEIITRILFNYGLIENYAYDPCLIALLISDNEVIFSRALTDLIVTERSESVAVLHSYEVVLSNEIMTDLRAKVAINHARLFRDSSLVGHLMVGDHLLKDIFGLSGIEYEDPDFANSMVIDMLCKWASDKDKTIGKILCEYGYISSSKYNSDFIDELIQRNKIISARALTDLIVDGQLKSASCLLYSYGVLPSEDIRLLEKYMSKASQNYLNLLKKDIFFINVNADLKEKIATNHARLSRDSSLVGHLMIEDYQLKNIFGLSEIEDPDLANSMVIDMLCQWASGKNEAVTYILSHHNLISGCKYDPSIIASLLLIPGNEVIFSRALTDFIAAEQLESARVLESAHVLESDKILLSEDIESLKEFMSEASKKHLDDISQKEKEAKEKKAADLRKKTATDHLMIGSYRLKDIFGLGKIEDVDLANKMVIDMLCAWANGKYVTIGCILHRYGQLSSDDEYDPYFIYSLIQRNKVIFARALTDLIVDEEFESASVLHLYKVLPSEDIEFLKEYMSEDSKKHLDDISQKKKEAADLREKVATNHARLNRDSLLVGHLMAGLHKLKDIFGFSEIKDPDLANSMAINMLCQWAIGKDKTIGKILFDYDCISSCEYDPSFIASLIPSKEIIFARALTDLIAADQLESASFLRSYGVLPSEDIRLLEKYMSKASQNYLNLLKKDIFFINVNADLKEKIATNHASLRRDYSLVDHLMLGDYRLKDIFGFSEIEDPDLANSMVIDMLCQWAIGKNEAVTYILSHHNLISGCKYDPSIIASLILIPGNEVIFSRALTDFIAAEQLESARVLESAHVLESDEISSSEDIESLEESMSEASQVSTDLLETVSVLHSEVVPSNEIMISVNADLREKIATDHAMMRDSSLVGHLMMGSYRLKDVFGLSEIEDVDLANKMVIDMLCQWTSGKDKTIDDILYRYGQISSDEEYRYFIDALIKHNKVIFARALTDLIVAEQFESASFLRSYGVLPSEDIRLLEKSMSEASQNYLNVPRKDIVFINTDLMKKIATNHASLSRDSSLVGDLMRGSYLLKDIFGLSEIEDPDLANSMVIDMLCQWASGKNEAVADILYRHNFINIGKYDPLFIASLIPGKEVIFSRALTDFIAAGQLESAHVLESYKIFPSEDIESLKEFMSEASKKHLDDISQKKKEAADLREKVATNHARLNRDSLLVSHLMAGLHKLKDIFGLSEIEDVDLANSMVINMLCQWAIGKDKTIGKILFDYDCISSCEYDPSFIASLIPGKEIIFARALTDLIAAEQLESARVLESYEILPSEDIESLKKSESEAPQAPTDLLEPVSVLNSEVGPSDKIMPPVNENLRDKTATDHAMTRDYSSVNHLMMGSDRLKDIFGLSGIEYEDVDLANRTVIDMLCQWASGRNKTIGDILYRNGHLINDDKYYPYFIYTLIQRNKVIFARALTDLIVDEQFESASVLHLYKVLPSEDIKLKPMSEASQNYLNEIMIPVSTDLRDKIAANHAKLRRNSSSVDHFEVGSYRLKDIFGFSEIKDPDLANSMVIDRLCQWASGKDKTIGDILRHYGYISSCEYDSNFIEWLIKHHKVIFARALTDFIVADQLESASFLRSYGVSPSKDIKLLEKSMSEASQNYLNMLRQDIISINTYLMKRIAYNHANLSRDSSLVGHLMMGDYQLKNIFGLSEIEDPDLANSMVINMLCQWAIGKNEAVTYILSHHNLISGCKYDPRVIASLSLIPGNKVIFSRALTDLIAADQLESARVLESDKILPSEDIELLKEFMSEASRRHLDDISQKKKEATDRISSFEKLIKRSGGQPGMSR